MRTALSELFSVLNVKDFQSFPRIEQSSAYDLFPRADYPILHVNSELLVMYRSICLFAFLLRKN